MDYYEKMTPYQRDSHDLMMEQETLRFIKHNPDSTPEEITKAQSRWDACLAAHLEKYPPLTGTFTYTEEDVKEAKQHGF